MSWYFNADMVSYPIILCTFDGLLFFRDYTGCRKKPWLKSVAKTIGEYRKSPCISIKQNSNEGLNMIDRLLKTVNTRV